jgi:hypothetical protein
LDSSGCEFTLNPDTRITTASVVKLEFMSGVLLRAQSQGRGLTQWERDRILPMITQSANDPASELWQYLGGDPGMQQVDAAFGLHDTQHSGSVWGLTSTSALDQVHLVSEVVPGMGGPLTAPYRAEARYYMTHVIPEQRWGASAGVPGGWTVAQKNGFAGSPCCGWRLNTVGWIERPGGSGWALAVLSDGWAGESEGIAAVHELSGRINTSMRDPFFAGASESLRSPQQADLFARGLAGQVRTRSWTQAGGFGPWNDVGGFTLSDPDTASTGPGQIPRVVVTGGDTALYVGTWTGSAWSFASLGGICTSGPSAAYSGPNRLDVFCRGTDAQLWSRVWTSGSGWLAWYPLGGIITADPDAMSSGDPSTIRVYARGRDNAVWQYSLNGGQWRHDALGGICTSGPTGTYSGPTRADLFCRGTDGQLWTRTWTAAAGWSPWSGIGGLAASDPDATSFGDLSTLQVVARGIDGAVWEWYPHNGSWTFQTWGQP